MTPEEKSLLERTYKLAEENNIILKAMRRSRRISTAVHIFYWVVIIGVSIGSYFAIQPLLNMLPNLIGAVQGDAQSAQSALAKLQEFQSMLGK